MATANEVTKRAALGIWKIVELFAQLLPKDLAQKSRLLLSTDCSRDSWEGGNQYDAHVSASSHLFGMPDPGAREQKGI
ncbi:hypothetical protein EVAR_71597_1 [Eumeta japonica]|uniref:Uncharacterized protein n=1 Tax=Eumeta variegata TaxID=151549 RepID=A0A4C1TK05_EUMVA|nr:hypothetical protein EVAR_71597_1 [Eumeta japonica]